jgi:hypothetical protein
LAFLAGVEADEDARQQAGDDRQRREMIVRQITNSPPKNGNSHTRIRA